MKWPSSISFVRHAQSIYNALRGKKDQDPEYKEFKRAYNKDPESELCRNLARKMWEKYQLGVSDYNTPLSPEGHQQALATGKALSRGGLIPSPDIVLVSPYLRTRQTWDALLEGGFQAGAAKVIIEDRLREQEHGLAILYGDWRIFQTLHPEQRLLRKLMGPYWYQYPQGESTSMVRDRTRDVTSMMIREFSGLNVCVVTHHLTILSMRANYERLSPEEFIRLDEEEKPVNCGITQYIGEPRQGRDGRLVLKEYNAKHY